MKKIKLWEPLITAFSKIPFIARINHIKFYLLFHTSIINKILIKILALRMLSP